MEGSKTELFEKAKNGSIEAYERLISAYQKRVYYVALSICGDHKSASDLSQELFIKGFKELGRFRGEAAFLTSIYKTLTDLCKQKLETGKHLLNECNG